MKTRNILLLVGIPAVLVVALNSSAELRDKVAVSPETFNGHTTAAQSNFDVIFTSLEQSKYDRKQNEIGQLRKEIRELLLRKGEARRRGAEAAELAIYDELIAEYERKIVEKERET